MSKIIPVLLRKKINSWLSDKGYEKVRLIPPIDLREYIDDPLEGLRISNGLPVLINVALTRCRSPRSLAYPCTKDSGNPFILTLIDWFSGHVNVYKGSYLEDFYAKVQPKSAAEFLGISKYSLPDCFAIPPLMYSYPWDGIPSYSLKRKRESLIKNENIEHGWLSNEPLCGWHHFGPVSKDKGCLEYKRLINVARSIQNNGYHRSNSIDGDIAGIVMVDSDEYRILITQGHHRIAALTALGMEYAPIRFGKDNPGIICRDEVKKWPGVFDSGFSPEAAISVFDRIFKGKQPDICRGTPFYSEL